MSKFWKRFINWLRRLFGWEAPPNTVENIEMANAHVTFDLPTTRTDGTPLVAGEIVSTAVSVSNDGGAHFSEPPAIVSPDDNAIDFSDLEYGDWTLRFIVLLDGGAASAPVDHHFALINDTPPNGVTNIQVDLT